jgi:uncharacterized protein (DUF433 family)
MENENPLTYLSLDPHIRFGKPCIKGTRIAVMDILQWLASGMSMEEILADFPALQRAYNLAALAYAAQREKVV